MRAGFERRLSAQSARALKARGLHDRAAEDAHADDALALAIALAELVIDEGHAAAVAELVHLRSEDSRLLRVRESRRDPAVQQAAVTVPLVDGCHIARFVQGAPLFGADVLGHRIHGARKRRARLGVQLRGLRGGVADGRTRRLGLLRTQHQMRPIDVHDRGVHVVREQLTKRRRPQGRRSADAHGPFVNGTRKRPYLKGL